MCSCFLLIELYHLGGTMAHNTWEIVGCSKTCGVNKTLKAQEVEEGRSMRLFSKFVQAVQTCMGEENGSTNYA